MSRYTLYNRMISRLLAVLLVLMLLLPMFPAASAAEQSGTCGEKLEWSFDSGTLTITGEGAMTDYSYLAYAPWYEFREQIIRLELPEGLTRVGSMAFFDCMNLQVISLPSTVRSVGELAFCQCSGAVIVRLNEGLKTIERCAFELCSGAQDIRLPNTLESIGRRAFYRCSSLRYVAIPASVKEVGASVYAYCEGLVRVDIYAPVSVLPRWTFYGCVNLASISLETAITELGDMALEGCTNLTTVYYDGTEMDAQTLKDQFAQNTENFGTDGEVVPGGSGNSESSVDVNINEDGDVIVSDSTVTRTDEAVIDVTTNTNTTGGEAGDGPTQIEATLWETEGWDQLLEAIQKAIDAGAVNVKVYPAEDNEMPQDFLDALAGKNVNMDVITGNGAYYSLNFSMIGKVRIKNGLDLRYTLSILESVSYQDFTAETAYSLRFDDSSEIPVELIIRLPMQHSRQIATLYQVKGKKAEILQSAVVDQNNAAHFYVANVDEETEYLIGIRASGVAMQDSVIPQELENDYGITEQIRDVDYVITGRKSSWGIGFLEVNQLLIGFMLSTASFVGLLMYALNKRKLRKGYVPGWDDDDEE